MWKRLQREGRQLTAWLRFLLIWVGIAAAGGILMWVNGVAGPVRYRTMTNVPALPSFTVFFLLWLLLYGLCGLWLGLSLLSVSDCRARGRDGRTPHRASLCIWGSLSSYVLLLAWYPVFFSFFHGTMAALLLMLAMGCHFAAFWEIKGQLLLSLPLWFFTIMAELYFLYVTISSNLLI